MKKRFFGFFLVCLLIPTTNYGQDTIRKQDIGLVISMDVGWDITSLIVNDVIDYHSLTIEKYINKHNSIGFQYTLRRDAGQEAFYYLDYRYYAFNKKSNQGFYILPCAVYNRDKFTYRPSSNSDAFEVKEHLIGFGGAIGYKILIYERLSLCAYLGMGKVWLVKRNPAVVFYDNIPDDKKIPKMGMDIGFKF